MQALHDWLDEGGQVFASHSQYAWFKNNPQTDFQSVATWLGASSPVADGTYDSNTIFPKGQVLGQWLGAVGALASDGSPPMIDLANVATSVSAVNAQTTAPWIFDPTTTPNSTKALTFETPIIEPPEAGQDGEIAPHYCGKAVFTDLHASGSSVSTVSSIPSGCPKQELTPQEKALEFLFFDLTAGVGCVVAGGLSAAAAR